MADQQHLRRTPPLTSCHHCQKLLPSAAVRQCRRHQCPPPLKTRPRAPPAGRRQTPPAGAPARLLPVAGTALGFRVCCAGRVGCRVCCACDRNIVHQSENCHRERLCLSTSIPCHTTDRDYLLLGCKMQGYSWSGPSCPARQPVAVGRAVCPQPCEGSDMCAVQATRDARGGRAVRLKNAHQSDWHVAAMTR